MPPRFRRRPAGAALALALCPAALAAIEVRFELNDAHVRERPVAGVSVEAASSPGGPPARSGVTDAAGQVVLDLDPGSWWMSYRRTGYIPIRDSEIEVRRPGQVVTTTLSMLLEAEGGTAGRRIRVVLNWGSDPSDVEDADAHVYCVCEQQSDAHVYYADMRHEYRGHSVDLDVDDRHWGGPETVTLTDPIPGVYRYWVHQYSRDEDSLGESDVVVRVFFDDRLAAEIQAPPDLEERTWRPFKAVVVEPDLRPRLVRFSTVELRGRADRQPPPDELTEESAAAGACNVVAILVAAGLVILAALVRRMRRR